MGTATNIIATAATAMLMASCATTSTQLLTKEDNLTMGRQADEFLRNMPEGTQLRQTLAIREAIGGSPGALQAVRQSRNSVPKMPESVATRTLSPTLRLYEPTKSRGMLPLIIYLHGGGWTFGSLNSCARFCAAVAATGKAKVLAVDYRLAPEHPFPAGLEDCIEALDYARREATALGIDPRRISMGGDSAGGNLALATALSEGCRGKLRSLVLFYPVIKAYADGSESWEKYGTGYGLDAEIMEEFNRAYTAGHSPLDTRISVGLCDEATLSALPPTLLIAAGRDILRAQGEELARRVAKSVRRIEFPEAVHLFITVPGQDLAFAKAVTLTADFLSAH